MAQLYEEESVTAAPRSFVQRHLTVLATSTIALGGITFGLDTGLIATTLAHGSFFSYMFGFGHVDNAQVGAIVATFAAGTVLGGIASGFINNAWGRRFALSTSLVLSIIGATIQTAANGVPMMIAGRIIAGLAIGILLSTMPIYISEIAPPETRGRLVGIQGLFDATGFFLANWVGFAGSYADGNAQWRIPLGMQIPAALVLLVLVQFLPQSPRWLIQKNQHAEAKQVLRQLHHHKQGEAFVNSEWIQISAQIESETENRASHGFVELFAKRYIRRTATSILIMILTQFSGAFIIQNYQGILYASLGFKDRTALLISGCYGIMGVIGQVLCNWFVADRWPRVRTIVVGCIVLAVELSVLMALSAQCGTGENRAGAAAGIAVIFVFSASYAVFFNSTAFVLAAEVLPQHLRSYGMGLSLACQGCFGIWISQVTPIAFATIQWRFYSVFIVCMVVGATIVAFTVPETRNLSLEEIACQFGDKVAAGKMEDIMNSSERKTTPGEESTKSHGAE